MDLERLDKLLELTTEVLLTYNRDDSRKNDSEVIQRLNDELWKAGYRTWIKQKDGKPCLSVKPRSDR
jgi:hypothetical protein